MFGCCSAATSSATTSIGVEGSLPVDDLGEDALRFGERMHITQEDDGVARDGIEHELDRVLRLRLEGGGDLGEEDEGEKGTRDAGHGDMNPRSQVGVPVPLSRLSASPTRSSPPDRP
jgi:hypothetical protein